MMTHDGQILERIHKSTLSESHSYDRLQIPWAIIFEVLEANGLIIGRKKTEHLRPAGSIEEV